MAVCAAYSPGTEQTEGEAGSVLGTSWFLSRSQCLGSSSAPVRAIKQGYHGLPLTG